MFKQTNIRRTTFSHNKKKKVTLHSMFNPFIAINSSLSKKASKSFTEKKQFKYEI